MIYRNLKQQFKAEFYILVKLQSCEVAKLDISNYIMQIQLTSQKSSAYMSFCFILTVVYFASIAYHISVAEKTIEFEGKLSVNTKIPHDFKLYHSRLT